MADAVRTGLPPRTDHRTPTPPEDTVTDFSPTHKIIDTRGDHEFRVGTLVQQTELESRNGVRVDGAAILPGRRYVDASGDGWYVSEHDLERIHPSGITLTPGKGYTLTVHGTADDEGDLLIHGSLEAGDDTYVYQKTLREIVSRGGTVTVVPDPDPLPTAVGSIVRKNTFTYVRTARSGANAEQYPWTSVNIDTAAVWYSDHELSGATILFDPSI